MGSDYVSVPGLGVQVDGVVLRITLDNPERRNALDDTSVAAFIAALERAATDERLRAVLLSGAGGTFCSGFDILGRNAGRGGDPRPRTGSIQRRLPTQAGRLIPLLWEVQLPVVCAVRGAAVGIGAQLALVADFTVAAADARLWYPFVRRGFTPDSGSTWLLPRAVGPLRARQLLMLGRAVTGTEAEDWGLAHAAVPDDEVMATAERLAAELADGPTVALGLTKALLAAGADHDLRRQLADEAYAMELSSRSPDFREGLRAFAERRAPGFQGR
ncbi:enoyl-CoA hydratase-related protein [Streptomyces sp. WMMC500]|uniref:enoyl-CoA hydratase/isomerase family protein n=1 Tax=Streptomyces sp. WMMC500 TaxID=3015154 RepID=UPI00248B14A1|nr:enoyl-CoA hydratase-related protein [Streptomyces sp. WMMC500]WBB61241.1 enoyl-CoA hydratase-related protein [Streptomyces sp. WMMC500]